MLQEKGISRRDFLKWAGAMTAMLSLPASFAPLTAKAAEVADRLPVIWLHLAECTGCSESLLRSDGPGIASLIFDYISLEYHETIMAASGFQAEHNLQSAMEKYKDRYVLMVEGGVPTALEGQYLTIGAHGKTGLETAKEASENAAAIFAIGTCSSFGGIQAANPNPTAAKPLSAITNKPVINVFANSGIEKYLNDLNLFMKDELGYEPKYDVVALFENYKEEMKVDRFKELRMPSENPN